MDSTRAGWEHFARAEWPAARDAFARALVAAPDDPEALDGLGQSLWWLGEREAAIDRRREAYVAYQREGDARRAGGVATYLAAEHRIDGQHAAAAGWLMRARRLLDGQETVPELGLLAIEEAKRATEPAEAERHARAALQVAQTLGDPDIECAALAQLGRAKVVDGRVQEGVALLDEAMTVALSGETRDPMACGDACCTTLVVCDGLADRDRAVQWCAAVVEFTERRHFTPVQAWCRGIFAALLVRSGEWERAEAVLAEALRRDAGGRRREWRMLPLAVLADLRLRQGRLEEAERLLVGLEEHPAALAPLVALHLERGETAVARALLERFEPDGGPEGERLALRAAVALAEGDTGCAADLAARLGAFARRRARDDLAAEAARAAGEAAARRGNGDAAVAELASAVDRFDSLGLPLEAARARLALARVRAAAGSPLALGCAVSARDAFERLGARRDADRAAALLRELGAAGRTTVRGGRDDLTVREREVLGLVVAGLSNAAIAERLVIAPKTAEHHVSRVLAKLGVRTRAEAAAHAAREGL